MYSEYDFRHQISRAEQLVTAAKGERRGLTAVERQQVEDAIANAQYAKTGVPPPGLATKQAETEAFRASVSGLIDGFSAPTGLAGQIAHAGFDLKARPTVGVNAHQAFAKSPNLPAASTFNPATTGYVSLGRDGRFLYPRLQLTDASQTTSVSDFKQVSRSVTGDVERALDATTEKAEANIGIEHVTEPLRQLAVLLSDIPNIVLESSEMRARLFDVELSTEVEQAIDAHVFGRITAADVPAGQTGGDLVAQVRNAVSAMRAVGSTPTVLALSPEDSASLDLFADAGGLKFATRDTGSSSPLFGLQVVETTRAVDPLLIDVERLGILYLGMLRLDADPFSGFSTNVTRLRAEVAALLHVRDRNGAFRIGTA